MVIRYKPFHAPALRMKAGELLGIRALAPDIADRVLPRMIVPPPAERDDSIQTELFSSIPVPDISHALSNHWNNREVLVETTHLTKEFGQKQKPIWFPQMFERARASNVRAIPLVQSYDLTPENLEAHKAAIDYRSTLKFSVVISSGALEQLDVLENILKNMENLRISPSDCAIIADFHDSDLSNPGHVASIISASLESLQSLATWQQIIFQGTTYPDENPAQPGSFALIPRNEWSAWKQAVQFDPETADYMIFGDYAADCAKLEFGKSGGKAIPHYRYTTPTSWLVDRGLKEGTYKENMTQVCSRIIASEHFAGRNFSSADDYIYMTAKGMAGPGNATNWRAINTTHHITRVVTDVGDIRGTRFSRKAIAPLVEQAFLF